jgi:hypothetical protein
LEGEDARHGSHSTMAAPGRDRAQIAPLVARLRQDNCFTMTGAGKSRGTSARLHSSLPPKATRRDTPTSPWESSAGACNPSGGSSRALLSGTIFRRRASSPRKTRAAACGSSPESSAVGLPLPWRALSGPTRGRQISTTSSPGPSGTASRWSSRPTSPRGESSRFRFTARNSTTGDGRTAARLGHRVARVAQVTDPAIENP